MPPLHMSTYTGQSMYLRVPPLLRLTGALKQREEVHGNIELVHRKDPSFSGQCECFHVTTSFCHGTGQRRVNGGQDFAFGGGGTQRLQD